MPISVLEKSNNSAPARGHQRSSRFALGHLPFGRHDLHRDVLQLLRPDHVAVEAGLLQRAAVGGAQQLAVIDHRQVELGALLPVDLGLVHLDVGLAQRAGGVDHIRALVVGRLDDVLDLLLRLF